MLCKICGETSNPQFKIKLLQKYDVDYHRCPNCSFLQTEEPYWLEEAYSSAISDLDLGPINRAIRGARMIEGMIPIGFDPNAKFIDWGGGYGLLTRLMRDKGYDYYWHDPHCKNLFAKQFIASEKHQYELMTAFEVFEHLAHPLDEIANMLRFSKNIFFTTEIPPRKLTGASDWAYFYPQTGQHISFYSVETLKHIANRFGLHLNTDGHSLHLLSQRPVSAKLFGAVARDGWISRGLRQLGRRRLHKSSLLDADFRAGCNA